MKNAEQFDLLSSPLRGRNLLEASAGTGKTFTIAGLFLRLLVEKELSVEQILVVTFTEAATEELRDRIRQRLSSALAALDQGCSDDPFLAGLLQQWGGDSCRKRIVQALADFDQAAILTIHGFCQKVLQDFAFECGQPFDRELIVSQQELLAEVVADFWRTRVYPLSGGFVRYLQANHMTVDGLQSLASLWLRQHRAELIPAVVPPDLAAAEEDTRQVYQQVADLWGECRQEVIDLLCSSSDLNRNSYGVAKIPGWALSFDAYVATGNPYPGFSDLFRFSQQEIDRRTKKGGTPPRHPLFSACGLLVENLERLATAYHQQLLILEQDFLHTMPQQLAERKRALNVRYFDDLLLDLHAALHGADGVELVESLRSQFSAALVDEFQDTDPLQYEIFRTIYIDASRVLFLIGDPKQSIYQFRGADIYSYLGALQDVDYVYTLTTNWRSCQSLVDALNVFWQQVENPFLFREIAYHPVQADVKNKTSRLCWNDTADDQPLQMWFFPPIEPGERLNRESAEAVISQSFCLEIVRLLQEGQSGTLRIEDRPLEAGDIAVLVRTNSQARLFQQWLQAHGVPAVLFGMDSLFSATELSDLYKVLCAMAEPQNTRKVRAALATDLLGWDSERLYASLDDDRLWQDALERFQAYHDLWQQRGLMTLSGVFLSREGIRERLLGYVDGERRLTNLLHGWEILQQASVDQQLGMDGLLKWLHRQLNEKPDQDEYQLRLESDQAAVKIVTIHKSKGLEYPVVFCPFCWSGSTYLNRKTGSKPESRRVLFHHPQSRQITLDLGSDDLNQHSLLAAWEELAENLRLLYVATTRAKYRCYLAWGAFKKAESSALAYCLHGAEVEGSDRSLTALAQHVGSLDEQELFERFVALQRQGGGRIAARQASLDQEERMFVPELSVAELSGPRSFAGSVPRPARIASFSGLVAGGAATLPDLAGWEPERSRGEEPTTREKTTSFLDFPRGAKPGTCLHQILECVDFANPGELQPLVVSQLRQFGIEEDWAAIVTDLLAQLLSAPLIPDQPFTLRDLQPGDWVTEMEFHLPVANLSGITLQNIFTTYSPKGLSADVLQALGELGDDSLSRYLKGFIDLVFVHQGRFYLLDWKSNHLGNEATGYAEDGLADVIGREFYFLQYHIYLLALHRYLRQRLPDYDYERHIGGVLYVFLRGLAVQPYTSGLGVHSARPSLAVIEALEVELCRNGEGAS